MNETSATSASGLSLLPDGIATLTAIHFTIIAVVAILVVIGLLWGIRAKRSRVKASRDVITNAEEAGVPPISMEPEQEQASEPDRTPNETRGPAPSPAQSQTQTQTRPSAPITPPPADISVGSMPADSDRLADEPIAAAIPIEASPATEDAAPPPTDEAPVPEAPAPEPTVAAPAPAYAQGPVTQLKGLGPKVATRLAELGVTTVGQMAALSESDAQSIDTQLGNFTGRMHRDRWIEQARLLAAGDKAGFEAVFGKL